MIQDAKRTLWERDAKSGAYPKKVLQSSTIAELYTVDCILYLHCFDATRDNVRAVASNTCMELLRTTIRIVNEAREIPK